MVGGMVEDSRGLASADVMAFVATSDLERAPWFYEGVQPTQLTR